MLRSFSKNRKAVSGAVAAVLAIIITFGIAGGGYYAYTHNLIPNKLISLPSSGTVTVGSASSLKFEVAITQNGLSQGSYVFYAKNIKDNNNIILRVEKTTDLSQSIYIVNAPQQKAWSCTNDQWTDVSSAYSIQYSAWYNAWHGYVQYLSLLSSGGSYSYTQDSTTYHITNIVVNPSLDDSLFTHG
jgi:hypothetical protein